MWISVNNLKDILRDFKSRVIDKSMFNLFKTEIYDSIKNISFKNLSDVNRNIKANTIVGIDKNGEIIFKEDVSIEGGIKHIVDRNLEKFTNELAPYNPLIIDEVNVDFEERFVLEVKAGDVK